MSIPCTILAIISFGDFNKCVLGVCYHILFMFNLAGVRGIGMACIG